MIWWFPKIRGALLGGPYNKDYSILRSILRSPYLGKLPYIYIYMYIYIYTPHIFINPYSRTTLSYTSSTVDPVLSPPQHTGHN